MGIKYLVIIGENAHSMIERHAEFLARVNVSAAMKLINQLYDDIDTLSSMPERNPFYEGYTAPPERYRKMLSGKRYLILYEITEHTVEVDYIVDCRQEKYII